MSLVIEHLVEAFVITHIVAYQFFLVLSSHHPYFKIEFQTYIGTVQVLYVVADVLASLEVILLNNLYPQNVELTKLHLCVMMLHKILNTGIYVERKHITCPFTFKDILLKNDSIAKFCNHDRSY